MKNKYDYIKYRQQKAAQAIREAKLPMKHGLNDTGSIMQVYATKAWLTVNTMIKTP
ncbi:MAG: hypothetical protein ABI325_02295 [Ginsengibacter sp.]